MHVEPLPGHMQPSQGAGHHPRLTQGTLLSQPGAGNRGLDWNYPRIEKQS